MHDQKSSHDCFIELLRAYVDIYDELDAAMCAFRYLYEELSAGLSDITDELDAINEHLFTASHSLKVFTIPEELCDDISTTQKLPF